MNYSEERDPRIQPAIEFLNALAQRPNLVGERLDGGLVFGQDLAAPDPVPPSAMGHRPSFGIEPDKAVDAWFDRGN